MAEISATERPNLVAAVPRRDRRWLLFAIIFVVGALLLLLYWGLRRGPSADVGGQVALNRPAPEFSITAIDGKPLTLSALRGKTVVLNVWASWCVPCRAEAGELNRAYLTYKDRNVAFVGLAWNDDDSQVRQFVSQYAVPYTVALDPEGKIAIDLGITGVPETFLIDPQGQLVKKWVGPITSGQLYGMLAPLVP